MRGTLKRVMYSRTAWFAALVLWLWYAAGVWYDALREGFSLLKTIQVVLATGLTAVLLSIFVVNRAWRRRDDDAR